MRRQVRSELAFWVGLTILTGTVFVACGGGSGAKGTPPTTRRPEDLVMRAAGFANINTMARVNRHFIANPLGHLDQALAVARSSKGGRYPVGTIIQLVPQEAMVKRRAGFNAATKDWEFFFLDVSPQGTKIVTRGTDQVVNRFGGNCASCHVAAAPQFDMVCEQDHGCAPLPIGDDVIAAIQQADPRPR